MDVAYEGTSEDARKVLNLAWYGGLREQVNSDLLLGTLLASQAGQIQDLRERVAHLEQADQ